MIDWKQVSALKEEVGAEDFDEVAALFIEEVEEVVERLRGENDIESLESDMHFLKGCALSLGFTEFSGRCSSAETLAGAGSGADVDVPEILESYVQSKQVFLEGISSI